MTVKALIVKPNGTTEHKLIEGDLDTLTEIVGGPIEYVFVTEGVHAYCHEEGKFDPACAPNPVATVLTGLWGLDTVMGTVVFLGDGEDGEEGDLPAEWLDPANVRRLLGATA